MAKGRIEFEIFVQDFRGNKDSIGTYQSQTENYTVCVNVENIALFHIIEHEPHRIIALHIEFKGKVKL